MIKSDIEYITKISESTGFLDQQIRDLFGYSDYSNQSPYIKGRNFTYKHWIKIPSKTIVPYKHLMFYK